MQMKNWLESTRIALREFCSDPCLDAQILLMHELSKTKTWVLSHQEDELNSVNIASLNKMVWRARNGEPIPYIIGHWEFYGLDFLVTPDVLIPRPETELLVEKAIEWLKKYKVQKTVLDLGTGSGCIAIALAVSIPYISVTGVDSSTNALDIARKNSIRHHVDKRIQFLASDIFSSVKDKFNVICANLPYIPSSQLGFLPVSKFEPRTALDGGEDGLSIILVFLNEAARFLDIPGLLLCEYGAGQEDSVKKMAEMSFPDATIETFLDLQGVSRVLSIKL
jgi:release factor glutamine methyltransferase